MGRTIKRIVAVVIAFVVFVIFWADRFITLFDMPAAVVRISGAASDWLGGNVTFAQALSAATLVLVVALLFPDLCESIAKWCGFRKPSLSVEFADIVSKDGVYGDHYQTITLIPTERSADHNKLLVLRRVCFLIENKSDKTIFDVTATVRTVGFGTKPIKQKRVPMFRKKTRPSIILAPVYWSLNVKNSKEISVALSPGASVPFLLFDEIEEAKVPAFGSIQSAPVADIDKLRKRFEQHFAIGGLLAEHDHLRNNDMEIVVFIHGRDVNQLVARFYVNLRTKFRVEHVVSDKY